MSDSAYGPLRLWDGSQPALLRAGPAVSMQGTDQTDSSLVELGMALAPRETLRSLPRAREATEPLTLQWYLELEELRYERQGRWIPSLLEFGKHAGDHLLGLGHCLGSDLIQYARNGAEVVCACPWAEQLALIRRNFELRGLQGSFLHAGSAVLPLESSSIDVACLSGLEHEFTAPSEFLDEVYRVLKPGGKVLAVVPARYDVVFWSRWWRLGERLAGPSLPINSDPCTIGGLLSPQAHRFRGRELRQLFHRFQEPRLYKRHLRRAELPHLWRWYPLSLLERLMGRLIVLKAFKPVSAAIGEQAAA
jgi:SAM-dependent methyltransferase